MRNRTPKRAALDDEAYDLRRARCEQIGKCDLCEGGDWLSLCVHEIPRAGVRPFVYTLPACTLVVCMEPCHHVVERWPKAKQVALIKLRRPWDCNLKVYNRWATKRLTDEDVGAAMNELVSELTHDSF